MAASTMVSGATIKPMAMASLFMPMETFMKGPGAMIKHTVTERTSMQTERRMSVNGSKINNMGEVSRNGLMVPSTRVTTRTERSTVKVA